MAGINEKKIRLTEGQIEILKRGICARFFSIKVEDIGLLVAKINRKVKTINPVYVKKKWFQSNKNRSSEFIYLSLIEKLIGPGYIVEGPDIKRLLGL